MERGECLWSSYHYTWHLDTPQRRLAVSIALQRSAFHVSLAVMTKPPSKLELNNLWACAFKLFFSPTKDLQRFRTMAVETCFMPWDTAESGKVSAQKCLQGEFLKCWRVKFMVTDWGVHFFLVSLLGLVNGHRILCLQEFIFEWGHSTSY